MNEDLTKLAHAWSWVGGGRVRLSRLLGIVFVFLCWLVVYTFRPWPVSEVPLQKKCVAAVSTTFLGGRSPEALGFMRHVAGTFDKRYDEEDLLSHKALRTMIDRSRRYATRLQNVLGVTWVIHLWICGIPELPG